MTCKFGNCSIAELTPANAWVPAIQAVRKAIGKPVTTELLADHTFCGRHAKTMRGEGVKMYAYASTITEIERRDHERAADRAAAKGFTNLYGALAKAGLALPPRRR